MSDKEQDYRIFVGGLSWDVTERQLEDAFGRFGKVVDCQTSEKLMSDDEICPCADSSAHIMLERDTGRPRGFGFLTFADRRAMEDAIRDMHGKEFGERVISVNKAQPKGSEDSGHGSHTAGGRGSYGGRDRPAAGQDDCFKCGRAGHWARDCPSAGGGRGARPLSPPPRSKYGAPPSRGDRFADDRDRFIDDRYDRARYGDKERYDSRDDRYANDRYAPLVDRFTADRYGAPAADRYPHNGYGKDRAYYKDGGRRGAGDRYGGGGGPARYDGRSYRERPVPYERPRRGGRPPSLERY